MWIYVLALAEIAGIITAFHAVMATRTSQGAVAWAVSLVTVPYLAVPLYWVFGRNKFRGYALARQEELSAVSERLADETIDLEALAAAHGVDEGSLKSAQRLGRLPATVGNRVELLVDGEATFTSILAGIESARQYVLVQFYILRDDSIGRQLKERLIDRASSGVPVYVLFDEIGSFALTRSSYIDDLRTAGVTVLPFNTRKGRRNRFQLNFRNHRKIVVVDGVRCWIGGHNVGDEYLGLDSEFGAWRDTHIRIDGPAAIAAQVSFVEDWQWASDSLLPGLNWQPETVDDGDTALLIAPTGPADRLETASLLHVQAINGARERLWIASPYFVPDEAVTSALQLVCLRGVDVRIIVPDKSDNLLVTLASYIYFDKIAPFGAAFFRYTEGFLHQKTFLVDDRIAAVGTANFDNRSFRLNFEVTAIGAGASFVPAVERMFEADFARSEAMPPDAFSSKPLWFRLAARLCRLMSPVL